MDIRITDRSDPNASDRTVLTFKFRRGKGTVSGLEKLLQIAVVNLLTDPGTDSIDPARGGGLIQTLRQHGRPKGGDYSKLTSGFQVAVSKAEAEMVADQASYSLPSTERLASMRLRSVLPTGNGVNVEIEIVNEAGERARLAL